MAQQAAEPNNKKLIDAGRHPQSWTMPSVFLFEELDPATQRAHRANQAARRAQNPPGGEPPS